MQFPPIPQRLSQGIEVRHLPWDNLEAHNEYQRLRARVFVHSLGWHLPIDEEGRERDHFDCSDSNLLVYGAYSSDNTLIGGIRIGKVDNWQNTLLHQFCQAGLLSDQSWQNNDCHQFLELTRLCISPLVEASTKGIVRDLLYGCAVAQAKVTGRPYALAIVDVVFLKALYRSGFVFSHAYQKNALALVIIDTWATVLAIQERNPDQGLRMISLSIP